MNAPVALDTAVDLADVASLTTVMVAPGMTPPPASTTVPVMADVAPPWAKAGALMSADEGDHQGTGSNERADSRINVLLGRTQEASKPTWDLDYSASRVRALFPM